MQGARAGRAFVGVVQRIGQQLALFVQVHSGQHRNLFLCQLQSRGRLAGPSGGLHEMPVQAQRRIQAQLAHLQQAHAQADEPGFKARQLIQRQAIGLGIALQLRPQGRPQVLLQAARARAGGRLRHQGGQGR